MKKNSSLLLGALFLVLATVQLDAQSFEEKYEKETIYLTSGTFNSYTKDGMKYRVGVFGHLMKKEMEISPLAMNEFKAFQKNRKTGFWLAIGGAVLYTSGLAVGLDEGDFVGQSLFLGGLGVGLISIPFSLKANKNLNKAVWMRNKDVLK